jgi:hypothetical protein
MARHVLFLIHGVGQRAPEGSTDKPKDAAATWWKDVVDLLIATAKTYDPGIDFGLNPSPNGIRIVPLSYCDIIVRELVAWDDFGSSDVAGAFANRFGATLGAGRLAQLKGISADNAPLFWGGPVDVLFYRLFFDGDIRAHVREQIAQALVASTVNGVMPTCSFICHSMGTAVLHDTLAETLASPEQFGSFANMDIQLYMSVANVSKVLQSKFNPNDSPVRPLGTPSSSRLQASVKNFMNVHHIADPVPYLGLFSPPWDPTVCNYFDVSIDVLKWIAVHDYTHYLEHPGVHIPVLRTACEITIAKATQDKAIAKWAASKGDPCPDALEALKQKALAIKTAWAMKGDAVGPVEFAVTLVDAYRAFEDARAACVPKRQRAPA